MVKQKGKIKVAVLFGGRSAEHEVSLRSARSVLEALDAKKYTPILIGITKEGVWLGSADSKLLLSGKKVSRKGTLMPSKDIQSADVVFPVLHGTFGEDGTMQGFLKLIGLPFVGPGVLGSAVGMDKDFTKRVLHEAGIPVADGVVVKKHEVKTISFAALQKKFGLPLFIKPANAGSSVGVSKIRSQKEFSAALTYAFAFDTKVLIEKFVPGREIECAVLGNEYPVASIPGEIIPGEEFYSYDDKYAATSASVAQIPANIPKKISDEIRVIAVKAYTALGLAGMTRVDFFLTKNNKLIINEVNTIPGFTSISMYPKLWEATGIPFTELIDRLLTLALDRFGKENAQKTSR